MFLFIIIIALPLSLVRHKVITADTSACLYPPHEIRYVTYLIQAHTQGILGILESPIKKSKKSKILQNFWRQRPSI